MAQRSTGPFDRDRAPSLAGDGDDTLQTALQLVAQGATISSRDGVIVFANRAEEQLFGYEPGELAGKHVSSLNAYSSDENSRIVHAVLDELKKNGMWKGEWINRRKDGAVFLSSCVIRTIRWRGGEHFLCVRQYAADPNPLDADRLAIATEAAALGVWEWDIPSNTFIYSARARAICGLPQTGEVTYEDVVAVTHPEDFPTTSAQAARALDPTIRDRTPYEYRLVRPDGDVRWVRAYGFAVFSDSDAEPRALRYIGTLEDITDRVAARLAEHEETRQIRLALESARMAVWSLDLRRMTVRPSPEFNQLFGFDPDANLTVADIESRYAPATRAELQQHWEEVIGRREQKFEHELQILRDGEEPWIRVRCEVSYLPDGTPDRAVGIVMDVTEERRALEAVRESDARFKEAADSAPAPVWMTNAEGKVEFGNRAMAEFAGMSQDEVLGDTWLSRMHPDDVERVVEVRAEAWRNDHAPYTVAARFRRHDGVWRWLEVNARARRGAGGRFKGYVGLAVDRTEAREALATLLESEERFRLLADSAPVMIWMSHPDGSCLYLNAALRAFWNVEHNEIQSFDWRTTMHPEDEPAITAEIVRAASSASPFSVQGRYLNAAKEYRTIRTDGVPRFSPAGVFLGMIGVNVDLTDLLEAQARQQLLLEELNHRVKNTLAIVQSMSGQTFKQGVDVMTARLSFEARLQALARAHTLLTKSNWERATLREVVDEALVSCGAGGDRITATGSHRIVTPKQALSLSLIFHELCTNATKYGSLSNAEGNILLSWRVNDGSWLELTWEESGGPSVVSPRKRGFGSTLLERVLPRDLQGAAAIDFAASGIVYRLKFPLERAS